MASLLNTLLVRHNHVCHSGCCLTFDNIFRKLVHNPSKILSGLVKEGDTVMDIGPGHGYFSIPMAKMAGPSGNIVAIDIQPKMLSVLQKRAERAGVSDRIELKLVKDTNYGLTSAIDFALTFWMVHEVPDQKALLKSIHAALKPNGRLLVVEPRIHVTSNMMEQTTKVAKEAGFKVLGQPKIFFSRSVLFGKV